MLKFTLILNGLHKIDIKGKIGLSVLMEFAKLHFWSSNFE